MKEAIRKFVPEPLLAFYHYSLSFLGAVFYGFPSDKIKIIGVTGTSGKSTVVEMTASIFKEAGIKVASVSSTRFKIGEREEMNMLKMTMPGRFKLQSFLREALREKCQYAIIEVTSEGIRQFRHKFITFDAAVFTNLSPEHIESHGGFENYRNAKLKLFKAAKNIHIINSDDENYKHFWEISAKKKISYNLKESENLLPTNLKVFGLFNKYNALAATKIALSYGVNLDVCKRAIEKFEGVPGRMELVIEKPFKVIVDYAHTPEQLKQVYESLKENKLICVLGSCGGGRDKWKRPVMGEIAAKYCDKTIITNEDPYDEDPTDIINQVAGKTNAEKILDRREAIKKALNLAKENNTVIITGKGSEPWMCVKNGKKIPWSDKKIVEEEYQNQ
jgi:UDP-N-acetylmuramoyl-L-alanyl-D-glutamate--2,6-diaminopimelate ligase